MLWWMMQGVVPKSLQSDCPGHCRQWPTSQITLHVCFLAANGQTCMSQGTAPAARGCWACFTWAIVNAYFKNRFFKSALLKSPYSFVSKGLLTNWSYYHNCSQSFSAKCIMNWFGYKGFYWPMPGKSWYRHNSFHFCWKLKDKGSWDSTNLTVECCLC